MGRFCQHMKWNTQVHFYLMYTCDIKSHIRINLMHLRLCGNIYDAYTWSTQNDISRVHSPKWFTKIYVTGPMCNIFVDPHVDFFKYIFKACVWHFKPACMINTPCMAFVSKESIDEQPIHDFVGNMITVNRPTPGLPIAMNYGYFIRLVR